jgi:hypothetical protein
MWYTTTLDPQTGHTALGIVLVDPNDCPAYQVGLFICLGGLSARTGRAGERQTWVEIGVIKTQ